MDNVFEAPEEESSPHSKARDEKEVGDPVAVVGATFEDLQNNLGSYAACGASYFLFSIGVVFLSLGGVGLAMLPGIMANDEDLILLGGIGGFAFYLFTILGFSVVLVPLMTVSTIRAADAHLDGGEPLSFMSPFLYMREGAGATLLYSFIMTTLSLIGMVFFYLPGLIVMAVGQFGYPMLALENRPVTEVISRSFTHFRHNLGWHAVVWILLFLVLLGAEATIIGIVLIWPFLCVYTVFAYRQVYR